MFILYAVFLLYLFFFFFFFLFFILQIHFLPSRIYLLIKLRQIISFFCSGSITTRLICKMYFSLRILFILCKRNTVDRLFFFFFLYVQKFLLVLTIFFFFKSRSIRHKVPARILKEKFVHTLTMVNRDVFKIDLQKISRFRPLYAMSYGQSTGIKSNTFHFIFYSAIITKR